MEQQQFTVQNPDGGITATKKDQGGWMAKAKKVLPFLALGLGMLAAYLVYRQMTNSSGATGAMVAPAPLADPAYGTATASGIPSISQYQQRYGATEPVRALRADPTSLGLTYQGAKPSVPVSQISEQGRNLYTECKAGCQGQVGCTDTSAANYNPNATCGCINCCAPKQYGCLDPKAVSFNPFANAHDDRFCQYAVEPVPARVPPAAMDCAAKIALNPDLAAQSGCQVPLPGCMDPANAMYNPQANVSDPAACVQGAGLKVAVQDLQHLSTLQNQLTGGCVAPQDQALLGGLKGCGDAWTTGNPGNSLGATMY